MQTLLPRANLNEQVYDTLRRQILGRDHGPGAKLSLHELAAELGVSRSPVHHALTRLVSEGLLTVKARRGYFVTPVTTQALVEGYEVRLALELHAADVAVDTAEDDQIAGLRATPARPQPRRSRTRSGTPRTRRSTRRRSISPGTRSSRASIASSR